MADSAASQVGTRPDARSGGRQELTTRSSRRRRYAAAAGLLFGVCHTHSGFSFVPAPLRNPPSVSSPHLTSNAALPLQRVPVRGARAVASSEDLSPAPPAHRAWPLAGAFLLVAVCICVFAPAAQAAGVQASVDFSDVWSKAAGSALKGGTAGLLAGVAQVLSFMWLRTAMNYQYFNGGNLQSVLSQLWEEGGIRRLYQGVSLALIQAPLSRFGDTAANAGVLVLMDYFLPEAPLALKTAAASTAAASWRFLLTPIDTLKTARQVRGDEAVEVLWERVKKQGPGELYAGAVASFAANWVGNYPYFVVFNTLSESWQAPEDPVMRVVRNGLLGMCSSMASDTVSNSLRVLKTLRQGAADGSVGYVEAAQKIIERDGVLGLLGRGLETRLLVNVLQGTFFTIVWKLVEDALNGR